jgi:hypothetical protein
MPNAPLRYRIHFGIFLALTIFLLVACVYPMIAAWRPIWRIVGKPWWFVIPIEVISFSYCCWMTLLTSYEIMLKEAGLVVTRPWGRSRIYRFPQITRLLPITKRTCLIRTNKGEWIPLSGLTSSGVKRKLAIESIVNERIATKKDN